MKPDYHPFQCVIVSGPGRSAGLKSVTTLHLLKAQEAAEILGLPDTVQQVAMLPVAYTVGTDFKPAERPGPETITRWNAW